MFKSILILLYASLLLSYSCEKTSENSDDEIADNDTTEVPTRIIGEDFLKEYLELAGFDEDTAVQINSGFFEFGVGFSPRTNGKITEISIHLPDSNSNLRITIWNSSDSTVLREIYVDYLEANVKNGFPIADLALIKDSTYAITFLSDDWFHRAKAVRADASYPILTNLIQVNWYGYTQGLAQVYPSSTHFDYYAGDLSFYFLNTD